MEQDDVVKWLRRGWWATRGTLLFILPLPLIIALFISLGRGDLSSLLADVSALALFLSGALVTKRGFVKQAQDEERGLTKSRPSLPYRTLGGALVSLATFVVSFFGIDNTLLFSVFIAGLCLLGFYFSYGLDSLSSGRQTIQGETFSEDELHKTLTQALDKIAGIELACRQLSNEELTQRLKRIIKLAREVLKTIEHSPADLHKARKFLYVYLDGTKKVCERYAITHEKANSVQLENNFRNVLVTIEDVFQQQQQRLIEKEVLDLDIQIEVLNTQLKREGLS